MLFTTYTCIGSIISAVLGIIAFVFISMEDEVELMNSIPNYNMYLLIGSFGFLESAIFGPVSYTHLTLPTIYSV